MSRIPPSCNIPSFQKYEKSEKARDRPAQQGQPNKPHTAQPAVPLLFSFSSANDMRDPPVRVRLPHADCATAKGNQLRQSRLFNTAFNVAIAFHSLPYKMPWAAPSISPSLPSPSCPQAAPFPRRSRRIRRCDPPIPAASVSPCPQDLVHRPPLLVAHLRDPFFVCFVQHKE